MFSVPPIPTPPDTINAPDVAFVDTVVEVTANPDVDNTNDDGL